MERGLAQAARSQFES